MYGSRLGGELDPPALVRAFDSAEAKIVHAAETVCEPDGKVRGLHREGLARAPAVAVEVDPPGKVLVEDAWGLVPGDASEVEALGETDEVAREPVAAEMARLPDPALVQFVAQRLVQRPSVARAAGVVLAVGADDQERMVDGRRVVQEVKPAEVVVAFELDPDQTLLSLARAGCERGKLGAPAAIWTADEQQPAVRNGAHLPAQRVLDLVREAAAGESVVAPDPAVLDEEPVVDPAGGGVERLGVVARDVGAKLPRA